MNPNRPLFHSIFIFAVMLLLAWCCQSCNSVFMAMYGIKQPKQKTNLQIEKATLPETFVNRFVLDTSYKSFAKSFAPPHSKNLSQPLQAFYFNSKDSLVCYLINCYTGGFPNLKWNRDNNFSSFPPKGFGIPHPPISLPQLTAHFLPLPIASNPSPTRVKPYTVVIFWSIWMGRQSRRFLKTLTRNIDTSITQVLVVNNDNCFVEL